MRGWQSGADFIYGYAGGNAITVDGDDVRLLNIALSDPRPSGINASGDRYVGSGGVRILAGRRIMLAGAVIESNDDALALVPADVGDAFNNPTGMAVIEDVIADDLLLRSKDARALNIGMSEGTAESGRDVGRWRQTENGAFRMASSIRRVAMSNIVAQADGDRCVRVHNDVSSGEVADIALSHFICRPGPASNQPVIIANNAGGVRRVRLDEFSVFRHPGTTIGQVMMDVQRVDGFTYTGGRLDGAVAGTAPTLRMGGVVRALVSGVSVECGPGGGIGIGQDSPARYDPALAALPPENENQGESPPAAPPLTPVPPSSATPINGFGLPQRPSRNVVVADGVVENVPAGAPGLLIGNAVSCGARDVRFTPALIAQVSGEVPAVTFLAARDPAEPGTYTVTFRTAVNVGQAYTVRLKTTGAPGTYDDQVGIGQGIVGATTPDGDLNAQGIRMHVTAGTAGSTFDFTVAEITTWTAAVIDASASACYVDGLNLQARDNSAIGAVSIAGGRSHRSANLFSVTVANNFVGGLLEHANTWTAAQTFGDLATFLKATTGPFFATNQTLATLDSSTPTLAKIRSGSVVVPTSASITTILADTGAIAPSGSVLILRPGTNAVVNFSGGGNLLLGGPCTLNTGNESLTLVRRNGGDWVEVTRNVVP